MATTVVLRSVFSFDEVIAALFDKRIECRSTEVRVEGSEIVFDFVHPKDIEDAMTPAAEQRAEEPQPSTNDASEADRPSEASQPSEPTPAAERTQGENEQHARRLATEGAFRIFIGAQTEQEAFDAILQRCHAETPASLDSVKTWKINFRELVNEYEAWLRD